MAKKIPNRQKTPPKKPKEQWHLSQRAKWGLIAGAAAIALIAIIWIVVYNQQALKLDADGKITYPEGQNWLVYNEKTTANPRYLKLGEVEPAEGYVMDSTDFLSDPNVLIYSFKPTADAAPAITYKAMVGKQDYKSIADSTVTSVPAMLDGAEAGEVQTAKLSGRDVAYYLYSGAVKNSQDAEKVDHYSKQMNAYVAAPNGKCVVLMIEQRSETGADYLDDQAFIDVLEKAVAGLKV